MILFIWHDDIIGVARFTDACSERIHIIWPSPGGQVKCNILLLFPQAVLDAGYEEDHFTSNVKIGVGSIT